MISLKKFSLFGRPGRHRDPVAKEDAGGVVVSSQLRQEFVKLALRDAVIRHSVPRNWIGVELLQVDASVGSMWDVRLVVRERNGLLWSHATDFRATFIRRLRLLDSQCAKWVANVSWQFPVAAAQGGMAPSTADASSNNLPGVPALQTSDGAVLAMAGIFPGAVAASHGIADSRSQAPSPQQIQLQKLREAMSQGDAVLDSRESMGQVVEFQETRPFQP